MAKHRSDALWVNPAHLDKKTKQELWAGLKQLDPLQAELLQNDPNISELKNAFSATVVFDRETARRYVIAGRKILEEKNNVRN